ncbi:hypothetical protein COBT_000270 [Conglomerata obtusa]
MTINKNDSRNHKLFKKTISYPSSCFLGFIFVLMDCVSYGRTFIVKSADINAENASMFIFLSSTFVSQLIYGTTTNIKSGLMAGAIIENFSIYQDIFIVSSKETDNYSSALCNTLISVCLGTLLFSLISFLLMKFNLARFLRVIPKSAITGCLGAIGLLQFQIGLKDVHFNTENINRMALIFLFLAILVSFLAFILQEIYSDVIYLIPLYSLILLGLFYTVTKIFGYDKKMLIEKLWLSNEPPVVLKPNLITDNLAFSFINFNAIIANVPNIITLALFSCIHLPINLPTFSLETGVSTDFTKELRTQSIANLFTAFCFSPSYFICSASIFFRKSGGTGKIHSVILAFSILLLFFYSTKAKSYIPCFVLAMFPFFIGLNICYSAFYKSIKNCSRLDYLILIATAIVCYRFSSIIGILFGITLNSIWFVKQYLDSLRQNPQYATITGEQVITINYILCFITIDKLEKSISDIDYNKNVIIDLRNCYCVDWLGKEYIYKIIENFNNVKKEMIGVPKGINTKDLKNIKIYQNEKEFYNGLII